MSWSPPFLISYVAADMRSFEYLPWHEQRVLLLKRLAVLFPRGQTFDPYNVPVWSESRINGHRSVSNPNGLACGFPESQLMWAKDYFLKYPWSDIVRAGYVAEAPAGSKRYEITDEGWAVIESIRFSGEDDILPF